MKVKCLSNLCKDLPKNLLNDSWGYTKDAKFDELTIGKEYTVYAITVMNNCFWYCLADDYDLYYPVYKLATLFEITDPRVSKYWEVGFKYSKKMGFDDQVIAYKEWVQEESYYELLTDNSQREVEIYKKYKKLIDEEFIQ